MSVIHGPEQNQRWAANLDGQSYDDVTFVDETVGGGETTDSGEVYLRFTPSGTEEMHGTLIDAGEVYLDLTPSGEEGLHHTDAATALLLLTPSGLDTAQYVDAGTVDLRFTINYLESIEHACFAGEGVADINWIGIPDSNWEAEADTRWQAFLHIGADRC